MFIRTSALILFALTIQTYSLNSNAKTIIEFENGQKVKNCADYNRLRATIFIKETVNNMMVQSEYLDCSLPSLTESIENTSTILDHIAKNMLIRSIPTSLGPSAERSDTLAKAGFKASLTQPTIKYTKNDHNVVITLKGKISEDTYLIWVIDEILNSTYRSYYPAKIRIDSSGKITPLPYYNSGY